LTRRRRSTIRRGKATNGEFACISSNSPLLCFICFPGKEPPKGEDEEKERRKDEKVYPGNRLQGVLPSDLQVFANLTTLDLSNNRLSGAIPRWIESFKYLKKLDLGNNDFSGPIPTWLGSLKNLEELVLDNNRLD
jgi:Leucine-rich repeat (LRR) protein